MNCSTEINLIAKALVHARQKMSVAIKDSINPHFKNSYADLTSIISATIPALLEFGIVATQQVNEDILETVLLHESGQWISSSTRILCKDALNPQAMGSGITYARRYALAAICCIGQDDDDAQGATAAHKADDGFLTRLHALVNSCRLVGISDQNISHCLGTDDWDQSTVDGAKALQAEWVRVKAIKGAK